MTRKFDRFMLDVNIGTNRKLRRLTPPERLCHIAGVLAIAAQAPIRGRLLIGHETPEPLDYAEQAGVTVTVAKSTLAKLRKLEVIVPDDEHGCEMIHDWADWNPEPKRDETNAERQRRYRERRKSKRHGTRNAPSNAVTPVTVTAGREEKRSSNDNSLVEPEFDGSAEPDPVQRVFDAWIASTGRTGQTQLSPKRRRLITAALKGYPLDDVLDAVKGWRQSAHHRGENQQRTVYNDLELLLRDAEHIERFRDLQRGARQPTAAGSSSEFVARRGAAA